MFLEFQFLPLGTTSVTIFILPKIKMIKGLKLSFIFKEEAYNFTNCSFSAVSNFECILVFKCLSKCFFTWRFVAYILLHSGCCKRSQSYQKEIGEFYFFTVSYETAKCLFDLTCLFFEVVFTFTLHTSQNLVLDLTSKNNEKKKLGDF